MASSSSARLTHAPTRDYNETFIYGTNTFCDKSLSSEACLTFRGGSYDTSQSSTAKSIPGGKGDASSVKFQKVKDTVRAGALYQSLSRPADRA